MSDRMLKGNSVVMCEGIDTLSGRWFRGSVFRNVDKAFAKSYARHMNKVLRKRCLNLKYYTITLEHKIYDIICM